MQISKKDFWQALCEPADYSCHNCKHRVGPYGSGGGPPPENCIVCVTTASDTKKPANKIKGGWEWDGKTK